LDRAGGGRPQFNGIVGALAEGGISHALGHLLPIDGHGILADEPIGAGMVVIAAPGAEGPLLEAVDHAFVVASGAVVGPGAGLAEHGKAGDAHIRPALPQVGAAAAACPAAHQCGQVQLAASRGAVAILEAGTLEVCLPRFATVGDFAGRHLERGRYLRGGQFPGGGIFPVSAARVGYQVALGHDPGTAGEGHHDESGEEEGRQEGKKADMPRQHCCSPVICAVRLRFMFDLTWVARQGNRIIPVTGDRVPG